MHRLDVSLNPDFRHLIGEFEEYAAPLRDMWTSFWLKAAAVYDGKTWHLCYFALIGRWGEAVGVEEVYAPGEALTAVSRRLDAAEARGLLDALVVDGVVPLTEGVRAVVPDVSVPQYAQWQTPSPKQPISTTADAVEQAEWRWLHAYLATQWLSDSLARFKQEERILPDLERAGEPNCQRFISAHFGAWEYRPNDPSFEMLQYCIDLPLALRVTSGIPNTKSHTRSLTVASRQPLALKDVVVTSGHRPTAARAPLVLTDVHTGEDGWTTGTTSMPRDHDKVWVAHPLLYRTLLHEIPLPSPTPQAADVLADIYRPNRPDKGAKVRDDQLLTGRDDVFEVALLNALARMGIAVLFAGQLTRRVPPAEQADAGGLPAPSPAAPNKVGPATPGFDLVTLDAA
jgi:hypothetical protein